MRITYSLAASTDGFIARDDGDVSWLDDIQIESADTDLAEFFAAVDGLVMGRKTYDFVFDYGTWPYEDKPSWVCTNSEIEFLEGANLIVSTEPSEAVSDAGNRGMEHLWLLGGGRLASSFLQLGLITDVSISEMPIRLGNGIPLFANHQLNNITRLNEKIIEKNGYRIIEFTVG